VPGGEHPLDATAVHPDRYAILESFAKRHGKTVGEMLGPGVALVREAADLEPELGRWTREHVLSELETPGRDPRGSFVPFSFREDVRKLEDLKPGLVCPGLVTNVTSFGVFVDIGLSHDGLVHVSQLGRRSTKGPPEAIRPGDRVQARVLKVDQDKRQISLSLKPAPVPRRPSPPRGVDRPAPRPKGASAGPARRPSRARGDGDGRREPHRERPAPPGGSGRRPGAKPARDRRPAFNNPFAVLADLKLPKKGQD
jgi:uncharacterized protein